MVSVSNNLTTEYNNYEAQAAQGSGKTNAPNSVYAVQQTQAANTDTTETIETAPKTKKEELENLCKELGTTVSEVFYYPIDNLDDTKLQNLIDAIKLAKEHSAKNGNFIELAKKYCIAVSSGYTVKEIKDSPKKLDGENINKRMERFFGLGDGSWTNLSETQKEQYIERYFNGYFEDLKAKAKKEGKDIQSVYRLQMRDFAKLLVNTSDKEKAIFKKAISSLVAENRLQGVFTTLASFETQEARTEWSDSWTTEERAALGKADIEGNVPEPETMTAMQTALVKEQSQEGLQKSHEDLHTKVTAILEKVAKGEELTEEEQLLYNTFKQLYAGEELGTIINEVVTDEEWKKEFLKQVNEDILTHGEDIYNEVLDQIAKAAEKHPEIITVPQEKLEGTLNEVTGNRYSEQTGKENTPSQTPAVGFATREPVRQNQDNLTLLKQQITNTEEEPKFRVDKNTTRPSQDETYEEKMANASTAQDKLAVIKEYFKKIPKLRDDLENYLTSMTNPLIVLNTLPTDARRYLAEKLVQKGYLKEEDIQKLNLSFADKQLLTNTYRKNETLLA